MRCNFKYSDKALSQDELIEFAAPYTAKFFWFQQNGYEPHYFQTLFHSMHGEDERLLRFRHLVAGRRGGKTLSAAWEVAYYVLHPEFFHWDSHRKVSDRPLQVWVLFKDHPTGLAAWTTFREVLQQLKLTHGKEYKENRGNRWFEFDNGGFVHFRTAEDPESLRGAGLDILWIDEAAFIPNSRAWEVSQPALADKEGQLLTTTTPSGKNWLWEEFWSDAALKDKFQGRVEYRSIDNPYFPRAEWERLLETYHPMLFRQEFMASFDAMQGRELHGDWLKYYTLGDPTGDKITVPRKDGRWELSLFMGVDPAISLSDKADRFAMALIGVTKDHSQVFLMDLYAGKIPFPEQVDKIREWHIKYKPTVIGIESNAFQAALEQQVSRLETIAPTIPIFSKGKKAERILSMSPLFKIGKVRIREDQQDFIDEWLNYDSQIKNPKDDCLDAVEIGLRTAGALLPEMPKLDVFDEMKPTSDINEIAKRDLPGVWKKQGFFDDHLGADI